MLDETGARRQESLRQPGSLERIRNVNSILKGVIKPQGVAFRDNPQNGAKITLVSVTLFGGYPDRSNVPVAAGKINSANGEEWTPEPGDVVLVQFINGNFNDPVVTGYLPLPQNEILATGSDAPPGKGRYYRRCSGTTEEIDKDGNLRLHVAASELREVVTNLVVTVLNGITSLISKGKTLIQSEGTVEIDGEGDGAVKGVVQGDCICLYSGKPHPHISSTVKASK